jgi:hypothetical protein
LLCVEEIILVVAVAVAVVELSTISSLNFNTHYIICCDIEGEESESEIIIKESFPSHKL